MRHRVGGLEKADKTGEVSHDPFNHQVMVGLRQEKVDRVANYIPEQEILGENDADLLVIGWGGTYGALFSAVKELQDEGFSISLTQFSHINPLPKNTEEVLKYAKKRVICELNLGQFALYLRSKFPRYEYTQYNKVQGLPFMISELKAKFRELLENTGK
jgi:2-oxoglutarate ferredoxin oxidoreductase subunit alpha